MKRFGTIMAVLASVLVTGAALAVTVDFSSLASTCDIALPETAPLNGVTLSYDDFSSGVDSAAVDSGGPFGTTGGVLILTFSAPTTQLHLDFTLNGAPAAASDALSVVFKNDGDDVGNVQASAVFSAYNAADPTLGGDATGSLAYQGAAFDQAFIYFSPEAPYFSVTKLSYAAATTVVVGDSNGDSHVDIADVLTLVEAFGSSVDQDEYNPASDLNGDGIVDVADLLLLLENFGK